LEFVKILLPREAVKRATLSSERKGKKGFLKTGFAPFGAKNDFNLKKERKALLGGKFCFVSEQKKTKQPGRDVITEDILHRPATGKRSNTLSKRKVAKKHSDGRRPNGPLKKEGEKFETFLDFYEKREEEKKCKKGMGNPKTSVGTRRTRYISTEWEQGGGGIQDQREGNRRRTPEKTRFGFYHKKRVHKNGPP